MWRVLVFTEPYYPKHMGGGGRFAYSLCSELVRRGIRITVLCSDEERSYEEMIEGVHVHRIRIPDDSWEPKGLKARAAHLRQYADTHVNLADLDLIHDVGGWYFHQLASHLRQQSNHPVIFHCQVVIYNLMKAQGWPPNMCDVMNAYQKQLMATADHLIFQCRHEHQTAQELGLVKDQVPVSLIPDGVECQPVATPLSELNRARKQLAIPEGRIILFGGRTSELIKGADIIYQAFQEVARIVPDVLLVVASRDRTHFELLEGMEHRVIHVGWLNAEQMSYLHQLATITVMPSRYEPLGVTAIEAMAAGTPVIVSAVGGLDEVVEENVTGLKLSSDNWVSELAEKLIFLLRNPDVAHRLGQQAARVARDRFAISAVTDQVMQVYQQLVPFPRTAPV